MPARGWGRDDDPEGDAEAVRDADGEEVAVAVGGARRTGSVCCQEAGRGARLVRGVGLRRTDPSSPTAAVMKKAELAPMPA